MRHPPQGFQRLVRIGRVAHHYGPQVLLMLGDGADQGLRDHHLRCVGVCHANTVSPGSAQIRITSGTAFLARAASR
jgi:hypothetical protein